MQLKEKDIQDLAISQAKRWRTNPYYEEAERHIERQWKELIFPIIKDSRFTSTLELACGHGRNSEFLLNIAESLTLVDVHQQNLDFCKVRFKGRDDRITYLRNNGTDLSGVKSNSVDFVYCFDSMVHFHSDVIRSYLREFHRCLKPGGRAFLHHSNSRANPGGLEISKHIRGRNFMTQEMFAHYSVLEGFDIISSQIVDWAGEEKLDCLTFLEKSADTKIG